MNHHINRLPTGVKELDAVLRGGLLHGRLHLIAGRPGTGKTTIGLKYLIEGVKAGQKCLYITLSETRLELLATADNHGWSLEDIRISERMPRDDSLDEQSVLLPTDTELSKLVASIVDTVREHRSDRVVIDSMTEIRMLAQDNRQYRRQIMTLRQLLSPLGATVLLLDDLTPEGGDYELESVAHGVICLEMRERTFGSARRTLRITKLRGGDFQSGWHDFAITKGEILVFPSLIAEEHHRDYPCTELLSGTPELDTLLGGGIFASTSTMIVGPSGVGKSTLALQYVKSIIRSGEKAAYFTFDEAESILRARLIKQMGSDEQDNIAERLFLSRVNPSRISPGAFVWRVRRMVEDENVRLVVIDSINSYLDVIHEERAMLLQMNELFSYLANMGVMSIIIGAHSSPLITSRQPDALSLITDNTISLRFYEHDGEVRTAISVIKKRNGQHQRDIREFRLNDKGVEVGEKTSPGMHPPAPLTRDL